MNAKQCYEAGDLSGAVAAAIDEVRRHPSEIAPRLLLSELFCFAGQWDRADGQLDVIGEQDPRAMLEIALFRQLLRAEQARQQFHAEGRLPEFLAPPSDALRLHLEASIRLREGQAAAAALLLEQAEAERATVRGTCNGRPFADLRDLDDMTSSFFEVLTSTGKYYWVPIDQVASIQFHPPQRPRDLLWRRVLMSVHGGPDGEVFLPVLYAGSAAEPDDAIRLGRATEWRGGEGSPTRGAGQRTFLAGDEALTILEFKDFAITVPESVEHAANQG
jgi:type VI secretion system protein ImpE